MFGLSFGHILLFGIIVLVFVGPEQLPEVARNFARFLNELRRTTKDFQSQFTGDLNLRQPWDQPLPKPPVHRAPAPIERPVNPAPSVHGPEAGAYGEPKAGVETAATAAASEATNLTLTETGLTPTLDLDPEKKKS